MYGIVNRTQWLTPGLVRITLSDGELGNFVMIPETDAYLNIAIPPAGAPYRPVFDPAEVKETSDKSWWPARRRYTVRAWRPEPRELDIDFVVHGDSGIAGPWAANAQPGDVLVFTGPGGGYRPDPDADWQLMIGDESALPAIAASLEALPEGARAIVRLLCDGPGHELELAGARDHDIRWLHRAAAPDDADLLLRATREIEFPPGRPHAFVHGEAEEIRGIRRHLLGERGLTRADMSCSPYWRRHMTDEAWRTVKRDFVAAMEAEQA
ncbi:MAG: siderophore-interacting protein [Propionicimonas sp.]